MPCCLTLLITLAQHRENYLQQKGGAVQVLLSNPRICTERHTTQPLHISKLVLEGSKMSMTGQKSSTMICKTGLAVAKPRCAGTLVLFPPNGLLGAIALLVNRQDDACKSYHPPVIALTCHSLWPQLDCNHS